LTRRAADFEERFDSARRCAPRGGCRCLRHRPRIIAECVDEGDAALTEYDARFDRHDLDARAGASPAATWTRPLPRSIRSCAPRSNSPRSASAPITPRSAPLTATKPTRRNVRLGARWSAVDAAGLYVPGGRAAYPSSVLMNAIPAKVAGVERIVMVTPTPDGEINPLVLAAAKLAGWTKSGASAARRRSRRWPMARTRSRRSM
jgi:histidinol dehydrogenase